jgi:hypothetical protein
VKSSLKCGQAFRIETVINDTDLGLLRGLEHLEELSSKPAGVNRRMVNAFACRPELCPCQPSL